MTRRNKIWWTILAVGLGLFAVGQMGSLGPISSEALIIGAVSLFVDVLGGIDVGPVLSPISTPGSDLVTDLGSILTELSVLAGVDVTPWVATAIAIFSAFSAQKVQSYRAG